MSINVFIAGHKGMVGSALYKKLLQKDNHNVITANRQELDLTNQACVDNFLSSKNIDQIYIAAAKVGGIHANSHYPVDFILDNLKIQNNVIEASWKNNVRRLLFLGSSCIYPKLSNQPIKEEELLKSSLEKTNQWYALAKISGIKLCQALRKQYGFDAISLMPTNLYGPNDNYHPNNSHVMAALIRKFLIAKNKKLPSVTCWGSGKVLREFMHVDDLASAIIFCLESWDPKDKNSPKDILGQPLNHLNIGTGKDISIKDLAYKIADLTNFKGEILWDTSKPDGTPRKLLNVGLINSLGWKASIDLRKGIESVYEKYASDSA